MKSTSAFPADYFASRDSFQSAATRLGWQVESHAITSTGPDGEKLSIDAAISPGEPSASTPCLIVSSGLHGIEGFLGAAIQLETLARWTQNSPLTSSMRCLFLHGLNPYGYAWLRRTNEDNIDLNRSFMNGQPRVTPAGYHVLNPLLNPSLPPSYWEPFILKAVLTIVKAGAKSGLKQSVAGGQYDYPKGIFYGGSSPSDTQNILAKNLERWIGGSSRVLHLDFHTGLGKWGTWKLLLDQAPTDGQLDTLEKCYGTENFQISNPEGIAYLTSGGFGPWLTSRNQSTDYLYTCAEFGTYHDLKVLSALRSENQAHHWGQTGDASTLRAKANLKEVFCPNSEGWRDRVLKEGYEMVQKAAVALQDRGGK